ncbi:MAG: YqaA family protein [Thermodesulfobacteriota bacterium]
MTAMTAYAGLFGAAFLAATILPAQSEAVLAGLVLGGGHSPWLLVLVASAGNILGALVNWGLGRGIERFHDVGWFPLKGEKLERAKGWYRRYGRWSLLLSWAPVVGDPLTVAAGVMRERLLVFLLLVGIAKTARYAALVAAAINLAG